MKKFKSLNYLFDKGAVSASGWRIFSHFQAKTKCRKFAKIIFHFQFSEFQFFHSETKNNQCGVLCFIV